MPPSQQIDDHSSMMSDGNQNTAATIMMKKQESSEEMYHTPFLMLIKNWGWLPEHIFTSKKDDETIPVVNLTNTQNSTHISFESQENSTESNKVPCCLNISKHVTRMDRNENRFLTSLENETSSSPAETGNYNVSSPAIIDIGMDKALAANHSGRSPGLTEEPSKVTARFKDHDNASLGIDNEATLDDWIEERLTGHKFEMCPWRSSKTGLVSLLFH